MKQNKTKVSFAVGWLVIYLIGLKLSSILSDIIGVPNLCNGIFRVLFVAIIILYLKRTQMLSYYGIDSLKKLDGRGVLYCIPFVLFAFSPLYFGICISDSFGQILLLVINMLCIGFIEEMIMRGFLFKSLLGKGEVFAVAISSSVFGLIHIVNLFSGADLLLTMVQIIGACAIGFVFVVFFYKTNNIIPCVLCHGVLDVCSLFMSEDINKICMMYGVCTVISLIYGVYLLKTKLILFR